MREGQIRLRDGRTLAYMQCGPRQGTPFLYCHGFPGSRLEARFATAAALRHGVRLIAADRPGFGGSDHQPHRRILDWPDDALELAQHLGVQRFGVLAVSGGAPYALACARKLPAQVTRVGIVCGVAPDTPARDATTPAPERTALTLVRRVPGASRPLCAVTGAAIRHLPTLIVGLLGTSPADEAVLAQTGVRRELVRSMQEAFRRGSAGPARDLLLLTRDWGFRPEEINTHVDLWHGELDRVVPASATRWHERRLPHCTARYYAKDAHYSIIFDHIEEIFTEIARSRTPTSA